MHFRFETAFLNPAYGNNEHNIKYLRKFIEALEPDVFVLSGETGADIISRIYKDEMKLLYRSHQRLGKTLFISITHPRTLSYEEIGNVAKLVRDDFLGRVW